MAATNGSAEATLEAIASRVPSGTILPPLGICVVIEKTAGYVARNGLPFEERIRANHPNDRKMSFLNPDDAYHPYYRWRMEEIGQGKSNALAAGREGEVSFQGKEPPRGPEKPPDFLFSARMPNISALDLDVVKLTAQFVAANGRSWMTTLSQKEAGNPQFDFLRPQHTLYQFFTRLVEQYTDLMTADTRDGGRPLTERIAELERNVENPLHILDRAKQRADWTKHQATQKVAKEELEEKERISYAQIDWHDFVVVETVVFDERDDNADLPPPTRLNDLQSASLEQKAAMSINPNRRLEEGFPSFDDHSQFYDLQPPAPSPAPAPQFQSTIQNPQPAFAQASAYQMPPTDQHSRVNALQAERDRARDAQEAARNSASQPMKIRSDYVPRAQARRTAQNTSICPNCGQAIPNDEMANHLRIEMLDPQWREQSKIAQQRSSTTNLSTADVANNLKRLASQRTDVFDPVTGMAVPGEGDRDPKRVSSSTGVDPATGMPTMPPGMPGGNTTDVQEQIRQLHQRFGGQPQH